MASDNQNSKNNQPEYSFKNYSKYLWIILAAILGYQLYVTGLFNPVEIDQNDFLNTYYAEDDVERLEIYDQKEVHVYIRKDRLSKSPHQALKSANGPHYYFTIGSIENFENRLSEAQKENNFDTGLPIKYKEKSNWLSNILAWTIPLIVIILLWSFMFRRMGGGGGGRSTLNPFDFGKSKYKVFEENQISKITFDDVAGLESAKQEIMELVEFLKNPDRFTQLGAQIPKGILLIGPPGTGKTLLAKAVAGEAKVPFLSMSGSEFVEMFVGVGASRVRDLFKKAKEKAPSIIFIDEIDAVGKARGGSIAFNTNDERESTLNQLLSEMDGFDENAGVLVLAATNRPDILDKALLRPGRFDRHVYLELPTKQEREEIFQVHLRKLTLSDDLDISQLASQTPGFSGADIANICNEAALIAAREQKTKVVAKNFNQAIDRIIGGLERKGKIVSDKEREIIAHHESGHATVSWYLPHAEDLFKVSIIPRGKSLGAAWFTPQDQLLISKLKMLDNLAVMLGGRAAEELVFEDVTSGALDDLEKATKLAYTMVTHYGLSEKLANVSYFDSTGEYGNRLQKPYSEATAELIDAEVKKLIDEAYHKAMQVLVSNESAFRILANRLIQQEVVEKNELTAILGESTHLSHSNLQV